MRGKPLIPLMDKKGKLRNEFASRVWKGTDHAINR